jgi:flagellar basal body-associated protein FliL
MTVAALIIIVVSVALTALVVFGVFIWAARKDGEEDRATQRRLGIRRRTRLGR